MSADPRRVFSILVKPEDGQEVLLTFSYLTINCERVGVDLSALPSASLTPAGALNATMSDASMLCSSMLSGTSASIISFDIEGNLREPSKLQLVDLIASLVASCLCLPDAVSYTRTTTRRELRANSC